MHIVLFFSGFLPKGLQGLACQLLNCLFAANAPGINYSFIKILLSLFFTALGLKPTTLHIYVQYYKLPRYMMYSARKVQHYQDPENIIVNYTEKTEPLRFDQHCLSRNGWISS